MSIALAGLILTMVLMVAWMHRRNQRLAQLQRDHAFADCLGVLEKAHVTPSRHGFPSMTGMFQGRRVRVELLYEALAFRKVPVLWASVTVLAPTQSRATLAMLARPQNTEYYSLCWDLPYTLPVPAATAPHAILRTDQPAGLPDWPALLPHLDFFHSDKAKELVITPRGVRLVSLAFQAERSYYMVLRQGRFANMRLDPDDLRDLVEKAAALHESLDQPSAPPTPVPASGRLLHEEINNAHTIPLGTVA